MSFLAGKWQAVYSKRKEYSALTLCVVVLIVSALLSLKAARLSQP